MSTKDPDHAYLNLTVRLTSKQLAEFLKAEAQKPIDAINAEIARVKQGGERIEKVLGDTRREERFETTAMKEVRQIISGLVDRQTDGLEYANERATWLNFIADNLPPEGVFELHPIELRDFVTGRNDGTGMIRAEKRAMRLSDLG